MNIQSIRDNKLDFLISALHPGLFIKTEEVLEWLKKQNEEVNSVMNLVPLTKLNQWEYKDGSIRHQSGKFFSIDGIRITTNYRSVATWDQPIINQPEIGILGFIVKKFNGILHFLMQAKIEPGNINVVQLSPTLQATRSNYTRVHKGAVPTYLEYFTGKKNVNVRVDQLQSEQGARFLHKRNRNIIIEIDEKEDIDVKENFIWITLSQIKELLSYSNVVNMDSRSVISCIQFGDYPESALKLLSLSQMQHSEKSIRFDFIYSVLSQDNHLHDIMDIMQWITAKKFEYELEVKQIQIPDMNDWIYDGETIYHQKRKYFDVIGVNVKIGNREVKSWDQPMIRPAQNGIMGFLVRKINGIYHFLVQAKLEAGNFDVVELAPTVQCLTGNFRKGYNEYDIPYLDYFLNAPKDKIWYSSYQSEEGGRFYKEQNLNTIIEVDDNFPIEVEPDFCWMTLNQMLSFVIYNNYLNIAARSLLSAIKLH